jgi:hypothetical protein
MEPSPAGGAAHKNEGASILMRPSSSSGIFTMAQPKLVLGLERLSDPNLLACGWAEVATLKDNAPFPAPWGDNALTWGALNAAQLTYRDAYNVARHDGRSSSAGITYRDAYNVALSRDVQKIRRRNAARQALVEMLRRVGAHVEFSANGNPTMLASSGFELRQEPVQHVTAQRCGLCV